jgi:hypothetical protein
MVGDHRPDLGEFGSQRGDLFGAEGWDSALAGNAGLIGEAKECGLFQGDLRSRRTLISGGVTRAVLLGQLAHQIHDRLSDLGLGLVVLER